MTVLSLPRLPLALAAALAVAASGCGGEEEQAAPLSQQRADTLLGLLDDAEGQFDDGDCDELQEETLPQLEEEVAGVSNDVDETFRAALEQETQELQELADECRPEETTTAPPPTETVAPPPTETVVPPPTETETVPPPTEETEEEPPPEDGDNGENRGNGGNGDNGNSPGSGSGGEVEPPGGVAPPGGVGGPSSQVAPPSGSRSADASSGAGGGA